ncbi:bacillithiol system redox-active protein YtxJ [Flavobacterium sediminis]|uniref:Bacillithiol system redox-active protein YtxJ n=1 Tax=Flavobacterium sediminis TaxID=2201181 RepID=A0A2U8QXH7_9FLAO|nr:bacillithiol system redox-active protein YtxJ [Flavobacterium sediminis]AWM14596.1 bacillithiol system redox-active protein YtxJ [Flavobacterium sediminis]
MSFFGKMFDKKADDKESLPHVFWNCLEEVSFDAIEKQSFEKPIVIFKHSTRCSISRFVWNRFQQDYDIPDEKAVVYYLDLLAYRSISNEIAEKFGVIHQSPQVIVLKEGKAVYNASHDAIEVEKLKFLL